MREKQSKSKLIVARESQRLACETFALLQGAAKCRALGSTQGNGTLQ